MGLMAELNERKKKEQNTTDATPKRGLIAELEDNKRYSSIDTSGVDQKYIDSFMNDANTFLGSAEEEYGGLGWANASSSYEGRNATWSDLNSRADIIEAWLYQNKSNLGGETYTFLSDTLSNIRSSGSSVVSSFKGASDYYAQWGSEDEYSKWYEDYQAKQEMASSAEGQQGWEKYLADQEERKKNAKEGESFWEKIGRWLGEGGGTADTSLPMGTTSAAINSAYNDTSYYLPQGDWTEEQQRIFGYLYTTSPSEAYKYAESTNAQNKKKAEEEALKKIAESATSNFWAGAAHTIGAIASAPLGLADYLADLVNVTTGRPITSDGIISPFEYSQAVTGGITTHLNEKSGTIDDDVWVLGGKGLGDLYGLGTSIAQSMASAYTMGSAGTLISYFGQGAASGVDEALSRGASEGQALLYGTSLGVFEGLAEMIGVDNLFKLGSTTTVKGFIKNILNQAGAEGLEEGLTALLSNIADNAIMGDKSNYSFLVAQYMASGMSEEEAQKKAWLTTVGGIAFDVIAGAASGGVSGGVHTSAQTIASNIDAKNTYGVNDGSDLIYESLHIDPDNTYAQKMKHRLDDGKNISGSQLRKLVEGNEKTLLAQDTAKMKSAVEARLTELGETGDISKIADVIVKTRSGEKLTSAERAILVNSKYGRRVSTEMNPDMMETGEYTSAWAENLGTERINSDAYNKELLALANETAGVAVAEENTTVAPQVTATPTVTPTATPSTPVERTFAVSEDGKARLGDTEVSIKEIASIKNGEMMLRLEDGTEDGSTVKASDVTFGSDEEALLYENVVHMGLNTVTANAFIKGYDGTISVAEYAGGFHQAYRYGELGIPKAEMNGKGFAPRLTVAQKDLAYNHGAINAKYNAEKKQSSVKKIASTSAENADNNASKGKKKGKLHNTLKPTNETQRASLKALGVLAEVLGIDIYTFETPLVDGKRVGRNGWYNRKTREMGIDIYAGADGNGTMLFTAAHELTHHIRNQLPAKFKDFADFLFEIYGEKGVSVAALIESKKAILEKKGITKGKTEAEIYDLAYEEVVADACESFLADGDAVAKIAELKARDKTLWETIKDFFTKLVARIKEAYKGLSPDSYEGRKVAEMLDTAEKLKAMWVELVVEASDVETISTDSIRGNADGAVVQSEVTDALVNAASNGDVLFSTKTEFEVLPKQTMSLSTGAGTILHTIEGLNPTKVAGLTTRGINGYTGRAVREYAMRNSRFTDAQIGEVNKFMDAMADFMKEAGVTYRFIGLQDVENATLHYTYNPDGSIKSVVLSAMVKNGDYPVNFDLSSICKKREAMSKLVRILAKRGSLDNGTVKLTPANIFKINTALKDAGYETACLGCFVESKRYNSLEWATKFCNKWNAAVKKVNPNATYFGYGDATFTDDSFTVEQAIKIDSAANQYIKTTKTERMANALAKYKAKEQAGEPLVVGKVMKVDGVELNTFSKAARDRLEKSDVISDELKTKYLTCDVSTLNMADVEFLLENGILPGANLSNKQAVTELVKSGEAYQHLLRPSDLLTDRGISKLEALPNFHGVLYGHYGSGTPKLMQSYTPYNSEIALLPAQKNNEQTLAEYLYTIAGVRMQSFSDFQIQNIYDYLQMVADLAARKVPAHAYTKEISFAKLLGMTGIKVNLSVMFDIDPMVDVAHAGLTRLNPLVHKGEYAKVVLEDKQGRWVYNIGDYQTQRMFAEAFPEEAKRFLQSIGFADAVKLQSSPGYSTNCGIIGVGYSDLGIFAMLDDHRIRYIIPYHASSLPAEIKVATNIPSEADYTPYQNNMKIVDIVDRNGNKVNWTIKEAYKRLGSGQAVINELNDKIRNEGWVVTTKKAQNGHGTYGLYEDLQQTNDPRQTANNFMDWCIGNNTLPLFYQFASHNNYYKLLYDYNVYDCLTEEYAPQQAVTNTYPTMVDGQVQPGTVTDGGFNVEYFQETIDKQMSFMDEYGRNLDEDLERLADNMERGNYSLQDKAISNGELVFSDRVTDNDTAYMDAVKRGDIETAREMVYEAADKALSKSKIVDSLIHFRGGKELIIVNHATKAKFTVFDKAKIGSGNGGYNYGKGFYFSAFRNYVDEYEGDVGEYFLDIRNPFMYDTVKKAYIVDMLEKSGYEYDKEFVESYDEENFWDDDLLDVFLTEALKGKNPYNEFSTMLQNAGFDGIVVGGGDEIIAFDSNQIKSADPVTYDDNGNVIPLSERFNTENDDIRYSDRVLMGSLFSGGGTLEAGLAYQMLDKEFGVEYDGKIASVYADNHGDHIQVGRVEDFDISKYDDIFYLHASPVCHNFSKAKHGAKELQMDIDSAMATAKHLETAMPQVFTVENAPGYRKSASLKIITDKLTELGYKWDVDVYNSADYGSATSRNRVILRAVKDGELPAKPSKQERTNSWDKVTRDLWETLPKSYLRPSFISAIENTPKLPILDADGNVNVNKPLLILTTTSGHQVTYCWEGEICPTLTTKCGEAKLVMPDGNIYAVTPEFMGRIQGLPDDYKYPKAKTRAFTIIGNGIPTHLTKAVIGGVLDSAYEQTHDGQVLYSDRYSEGLSEEDKETAKKVISNLKQDKTFAKYYTGYGAYTEKRINREISYYSAEGDPDYAKGYIVWVKPIDFIYATTATEAWREQLTKEAGDLDKERLANEQQPIYLNVDFETGRITGHEGRHRMIALEKAGVKKVAVIIQSRNDQYWKTKPIEIMKLEGQDFGDYKRGLGFYLHNMLPLSERYADVAREMFSFDSADGVRFSDRDTESVSNRSLLANALEGTAQNDVERNKLAEYKSKIALIESEQAKLAELRAKIKELSFATGPRDTEALKKLQFEANQTANRINTYDRQLLTLESTKALKGVLDREKAMAYKRAEQRGREALKEQRDKDRERNAKTQRELMTRYQESRKKGIEGRRKTEMRYKIKQVVNELNQYLLKGTKEKHVPIELQKFVAMALDSVNMDTVGAEERIAKKREEMRVAAAKGQIDTVERLAKEIKHIEEMGGNLEAKLERFKTAYDSIQNSDDPLIANAHDEAISNAIARVVKVVGKTPIRDMSLTQLEEVYDMYKMVLTSIRKTNQAFKMAKSEEISTLANRIIEDLVEQKKKPPYSAKAMQKLSEFDWNNLKPVYAFERIGSATFTELFNNVRAGEDTWAADMSEAEAFRDEQFKKHNYRSFDFNKKYDFVSSTGRKFTLRLGQIMSLYAYAKRGPQARNHLKYGGFQFDGLTEVKEKTKLGTTKTLQLKDSTVYKLSDELLDEIVGKLTPEQKAFVDAMQDYLSTVMGEKGNEVSLALYDIKLFKEKNYFPLKVSHDFLARAREQAQGEVKIKNYGFTKETDPNAKKTIVLSSFMDVWAGHVNEMSMYHAFTLALEDFYRVFSYGTPAVEGMDSISVVSSLRGAHRDGAVNYIDQLLKDLNGGAKSDPRETLGKSMISTFKKAKVFTSLSVVAQQYTAIVRAMALVDAKYFVGKKATKGRHKAKWEEIKKYAPVAVIKEMGYFDTGMGKGSVEWLKGDKTWKDKAEDILSKAPAFVDEVAWIGIWNAVKRETIHKRKDLSPTSEEFLKACGERFTEVIVKTQVYDSTLARSANMRSKGTFMTMVTAFMAEPTTTINMVQDAFRKFKGNKKHFAKTMGSVLGSVVFNAAVVSLVYAMRDDDEDETYAEKYLSRFVTEVVDGVNPLTYIPLVKDIWSAAQGFDIERADMSLITDTLDAFQQVVKVVSKDTSDMDDEELDEHSKAVTEAWLSVADGITALFGIPMGNVRRDVKGVINLFETFGRDQVTTAGSIADNIGEDLKDSVPVWGWFPDKSKGDKLYDAIMDGDKEYADRLKEYAEIEHFYTALVEEGPIMAQAVKEVIISAKVDDGKTLEEAEESFINGVTSSVRKHYEDGDISENDAMDFLIDFCGLSTEEAKVKVQYWSFKMDNPDTYVDDSWISEYYADGVSNAGISMEMFVAYRNRVKNIKGENKKRDRMAVINSLPISSAQKDALYFAEGWTASKLWEAPWH